MNEQVRKIVEVDLQAKGTDLHDATVVGDTVGRAQNIESTEKVGRGGDIAVFFADHIWALSTFNNRWGVLFRCRWGAGVWW